MGNKIVRVQGPDAVGRQHLRRKVAQIARHNDIGAGPDRGGEDVTVVRVWKIQRIDKIRIVCHKAIANGIIHQEPGTLQAFAWNVPIVPRTLRIHSSWISSVQRALSKPACVRRTTRSRTGAEYRTQASIIAVGGVSISNPYPVPD